MNSKRKGMVDEVIVVGQEDAAPERAPVTPAPVSIPISFDAWWIRTATKYNLNQDLKAAIKRHFESRGFMDYKKFDQGLKDFGFRT
jgi:hypothetical protein